LLNLSAPTGQLSGIYLRLVGICPIRPRLVFCTLQDAGMAAAGRLLATQFVSIKVEPGAMRGLHQTSWRMAQTTADPSKLGASYPPMVRAEL
jgi:hypothetical protein